jgi:hypothetical protein
MLALAMALLTSMFSPIPQHLCDVGGLMGFLGLLKLPCCAVLLAAFALVASVSMVDLHQTHIDWLIYYFSPSMSISHAHFFS